MHERVWTAIKKREKKDREKKEKLNTAPPKPAGNSKLHEKWKK